MVWILSFPYSLQSVAPVVAKFHMGEDVNRSCLLLQQGVRQELRGAAELLCNVLRAFDIALSFLYFFLQTEQSGTE